MGKEINPNDILVWAQIGGQMTQIAVTAIHNLSGILKASGQSEDELKATLARTHAMYDKAIAREEEIAKGDGAAG